MAAFELCLNTSAIRPTAVQDKIRVAAAAPRIIAGPAHGRAAGAPADRVGLSLTLPGTQVGNRT